MLFILVVVNLVCWTPWQAYTITYTYASKPISQRLVDIQEPFHDIKFYLIFFNSAINPLIYGYWNINMRRAFRPGSILSKPKVRT